MNINIDGVNAADGLKRFAGNEKLYTKSLLRFATDYPPPPPDTAEDERKKYTHMVKGVAGNLGIYDLAEAAAQSDREISDMVKYADFTEQMLAVSEKIKQAFASDGGTVGGGTAKAGAAGGREEYLALTARLRLAAERFNPSECETILEKLCSRAWEGIDPGVNDALSKALDNYDFDGILKILPKS
jgi:hypothetical protein